MRPRLAAGLPFSRTVAIILTMSIGSNGSRGRISANAPYRPTSLTSGTLVSALAFELFPEAVHLGRLWPAGLGLIAGRLTFVLINPTLDSWVAKNVGDVNEVPTPSPEAAKGLSGAETQQTKRVEEVATGGADRAALEEAFSCRAVDALLTKSPGVLARALPFCVFCRQLVSGGTRIRTGDTMIFS